MNEGSWPADHIRPLAQLLFGPGAPADDEVLARSLDEQRTAAALREQAGVLADALIAAGVRPGHRVAALLPSNLDALVTLFAVWRARAVVVPVNPRLTGGEIGSLLDATAASVVIASQDEIARLATATDNRLVVDRATGAVQRGGADLTRLAHLGEIEERGDAAALILTTSGTTGPRKPVVLNHGAILAGIDTVLLSLTRSRSADATKRRRPNIIPVPLALWAGIYNALFALRSGSSVILIDSFTTRAFADVVRQFDITSSVLAPAMIAMLTDDVTIADLAPMRLVRSITAPLSPLQARRFHERFGVSVLNSYGQTELGGEVIGWNAADARTFATTKLGALGRPHDGIEVQIRAHDRATGPGAEGELCVRSPYMMAGYLDIELGDRLTSDGFLRTGDIGFIDGDGFVWLSGRVTDLIIRGGLKIFPAEVEEVLRLHPDLADVAVVAVPDERLGEVPWAFYVRRHGATGALDSDELIQLGRRHLAPYKIPVRFEAVESLPRNHVGKILRGELIDRAELVAVYDDTSPPETRALVRRWLEEHLPSAWRDAVADGGLMALRDERSRAAYEAWYPTFGRSGLAVATWPRNYGGLGVGATLARAIEEELAPYQLGRLNILGINLAGTTLLEWGSDDQKARFLPPIVRNEQIWCQLFSEPGAGSDLPSLATRAERHGDNWRLTGQKVWSTWAHQADIAMVLARTDSALPKREGITYFALDLDQPGVEIRPLRQINGDAEFNEVFLDGAIVADHNRIGAIGAGWRVARTTLSGERTMISGAGSGAGVDNLGGRSIERLIQRARAVGQHEVGDHGAAPWDDPIVRQQLAHLWSQKQTIKWTNLRARANRQDSRPAGPESSVAKLLQTRHNMALQQAWIDLVGMRAVAHEADDDDSRRLGFGFLRSRANSIEGGTTEVQKNTIGERVLGLAPEPDPFHGRPWSSVPR